MKADVDGFMPRSWVFEVKKEWREKERRRGNYPDAFASQ
jgi:hypothetical protein